MIRQLAHTCFTTTDLDATVSFYRDKLGLDVRFHFLRGDEKIGCYFQIGNQTFLECFKRKSEEHQAGDIRHFCFEVEDMETFMQRLKDAGVETRGRRTGSDGSAQFWCTDPNGIDIEFQQYNPESAQLTGQDCHMGW